MLRITGYSDKYSLCPGEQVRFYVNAEQGESYEMQMVRLIHGDTNPDGPGYKEEEINAPCNGTYPGQHQRIHGGSYIIIPQDERQNLESFTLQAYIYPTTPDKGRQGILTKWVEDSERGYGLFIDDDACLCVQIGDGNGLVMKLSSGKKLMRKVWYLAAASYDSGSGRVTLYQEPVVTPTNGGLGMSLLHPADQTTATVETVNSMHPGRNDAPLLMAASTLVERSGRTIFGGHFREATAPVELPEQGCVYNGKIDRPRLSPAGAFQGRDRLPRARLPGLPGGTASRRRRCLGFPRQHYQEHRVDPYHRHLPQRAEWLHRQSALSGHDGLQLDSRRDRLPPQAR